MFPGSWLAANLPGAINRSAQVVNYIRPEWLRLLAVVDAQRRSVTTVNIVSIPETSRSVIQSWRDRFARQNWDSSLNGWDAKSSSYCFFCIQGLPCTCFLLSFLHMFEASPIANPFSWCITGSIWRFRKMLRIFFGVRSRSSLDQGRHLLSMNIAICFSAKSTSSLD
jgi:hypothetical protein